MGDAGDAETSNASQIAAAFAAFPSPASASDVLSTPLLECAPKTPSSAWAAKQAAPRNGLLETAAVVPAVPDPICFADVQTPPVTDVPHPTLNMIVGGALAPTHEIPPQASSSTTSKPRPGFRLPSFDLLGIAAPHPDRFGIEGATDQPAHSLQDITPESLSSPSAAIDMPNAFEALTLQEPSLARTHSLPDKLHPSARPLQSPLFQGPLTPPDDVPYLDWSNVSFAHHATVPDVDRPADGLLQGDSAQDGAVGESSAQEETQSAGQSAHTPPLMWYDAALQAIIDNVIAASHSTNSLRVLSHALPSPSPEGHIYAAIIAAVQQKTTAVESWINVFHAIPGRFNLADLPRSPPSTPGPAVGGQDYFTEKVFDSAVSIADYQEDLLRLPRSPRTVVPPGSVDIGIVERYIPPSSSNEFSTLFELNGQSILVDRLKELSRNDGTLLLIYPTREGGVTFMREYLSPILDPVLRSMVVVHGLSSSLANTLGNMNSVDQLPSHATFHRRTEALLSTIARGGPAVQRAFEQKEPVRFVLSHCSKQFVMLNRETWAQNWWTKQEKPRIREVVTRYAREAQTRSSNVYIERPRTSTELLQELLKGVAEKTYPRGQEPERGIEVSVAVIKRSA